MLQGCFRCGQGKSQSASRCVRVCCRPHDGLPPACHAPGGPARAGRTPPPPPPPLAPCRGLGDTRVPFYATLAANVLNVGLEVALIFGLGLGVRGAALAVGLGQARGLARGGVWEAAQ